MPRPRRRAAVIEALEDRTLLSSPFLNVNITQMPRNQAEGAITIDRANPSNLFAASNVDQGDGIVAAISTDGGATWSRKVIANDTDSLPPAVSDPSTQFDSFGNLFLTYLTTSKTISSQNNVVLLRSTDGGQTFSTVTTFAGNFDQPTVVVGPASVWVQWDAPSAVEAAGAADSGLGVTGSFTRPQTLPGSAGGSFGDIAIGPSGQVMVSYEVNSGGGAKILVNVDPDGLGSAPFGKAILVSSTHVPNFDFIPAQPNRSIDAESGLAFDRSGGPFNGRVYMVYTDQTPGIANTDIMLRYSDNNGATWSNAIRVNDDTTLNSQMLPRISLDNTTGDVAIGWYDARNDLGNGVTGDTNHIPNDDVEYYGTIVKPVAQGVLISPNLQISAGVSDANDAFDDNSIDFGDYVGLDFYSGTFHPLWADNSNSTGDNPDGTLKKMDQYTATVPDSAFGAAGTVSLGGLSDPSGLVATLPTSTRQNPGFIKHGKFYTITVQYADAAGVNLASIASSNLLITGPGTFIADPQLLHVKSRKGGSVLATYRLASSGAAFTSAQAGTYTIQLEPNQVLDSARHPSSGGILGTFAIATAGRGAHGGGTGTRGHPQHDR